MTFVNSLNELDETEPKLEEKTAFLAVDWAQVGKKYSYIVYRFTGHLGSMITKARLKIFKKCFHIITTWV